MIVMNNYFFVFSFN